MILAGDVGGTKTYLALCEVEDGRPHIVRRASFRTQDYPGLGEIIREFLPTTTHVQCGAIGVPGAIVNGGVVLSNVSWNLREDDLSRELKFPVSLINDLVATGIGIGVLSPDKLLTLSEGEVQGPGTIALIAAGTGLGESVLYWNGQEHSVQPCEGGMADFAPHDDLQIELLRYMRRELPVVCVEKVLSGPGLVSIYKFLRDTGRGTELPEIASQLQREDPASVIANAAANETCPMAAEALDIFLSIYGSEAGNLALRAVSIGGVYVGGGIASRISKQLANGRFMKSFFEKDPTMADFMKQVPVKVILEDKTGLLGAAQYAVNHHLSITPPI